MSLQDVALEEFIALEQQIRSQVVGTASVTPGSGHPKKVSSQAPIVYPTIYARFEDTDRSQRLQHLLAVGADSRTPPFRYLRNILINQYYSYPWD
jgi:hypothetical protein